LVSGDYAIFKVHRIGDASLRDPVDILEKQALRTLKGTERGLFATFNAAATRASP